MYYIVIASTGILGVLSGVLGAYSLIKNPKSSICRVWFLLCMAVVVWCFGYLKATFSDFPDLLALKILYVGAIFIPILFFDFTSSFLLARKRFTIFLYIGYILSLFFLVLLWSTNLLISGVIFTQGFGFHEEPGSLFYIFLAYFFVYPIISTILLFKVYSKSDGIRRKQILYLIFATILAFIGGGTNFLTDIFHIFPYGQMVVFMYPVLVTYGIFLPEIKIKF